MMVRYAIVRVDYPPGTGEYEATKLGDQLRDFAAALGDAYIVDEGLAEPTEVVEHGNGRDSA